jgi:hypothetical protein
MIGNLVIAAGAWCHAELGDMSVVAPPAVARPTSGSAELRALPVRNSKQRII